MLATATILIDTNRSLVRAGRAKSVLGRVAVALSDGAVTAHVDAVGA